MRRRTRPASSTRTAYRVFRACTGNGDVPDRVLGDSEGVYGHGSPCIQYSTEPGPSRLYFKGWDGYGVSVERPATEQERNINRPMNAWIRSTRADDEADQDRGE